MGCAVACVAFRCGISYTRAHRLFSQRELAWPRGYYCGDVVAALAAAGYDYAFAVFDEAIHAPLLKVRGSIVFIDSCAAYPAGHYLIRAERGWMNPWTNFPRMLPVRAGFRRRLNDRVGYILFKR
jgi:hypothetical protein